MAEIADEEWRAIAATIREEIARRRISRQALADIAQISLSTLEKALAGKRSFTMATLVRLEQALGLALRPAGSVAPIASASPSVHAPFELGGYSRQSVSWLEGRYLTIRPGFGKDNSVHAYLTTIRWDENSAQLVFAENGRTDAQYAQKGVVSAPYISSHIYLVTNDHGQFRTITLGRMTPGRSMHGLLNTLAAGSGTQLTPVACPIILQAIAADDAPMLGEFAAGHPEFGAARALLDQTLGDGFARMCP